MSRARLAPVAIVLFALLAVPRAANAGIIDYIWEMSGPPLIGFLTHCQFDLQENGHECRLVDVPLSDNRLREQRRLWLTLTGGVYFSTGKDSDTNEFGFGSVKMLAYEPTLDLRSYNGRVKVDHGVMGLSYFFLIGSKFKNYDNIGLKLVPIAVTVGKWNVTYSYRIFPNGFTSEQFGGDPESVADKRSELVHGISIGYSFGRR